MAQTNEYRISDTRGKFTQVLKNGRKLSDVSWIPGRIILSNRRVVLVGNSGKRTIPLSKVTGIEGRFDVNQMIASVSGYTSLRMKDDVFLVTAEDPESLELDIIRAVLDQRIVTVKHPAVEGGVVTDAEWEQARLKVEDDGLNIAMRSGRFVRIALEDVSTIVRNERTVERERRTVVEAEHTEDGTNVQTYLSGNAQQIDITEVFLRKGERGSQAALELGGTESEVVMALYSGVSTFDIPDFLGLEIEEVESIFDDLIEHDVLNEVRIRREVELTARGRNIASESMNEQ